MALIQDYRVRPALSGDSDQIAHLLSHGSFVHRHLDWRTPLEWIGYQPYLVLEHKGQVKSILACPPDPPSIDWVRVFATDMDFSPDQAWKILWENVLPLVKTDEERKVAAIVLERSFQKLLIQSGFASPQEIVMFTWVGENISVGSLPEGFQIRDMLEADIPRVAELDAEAFDPLWQNTTFSLKKAFHQAAVTAVVERKGEILGYQISTKNIFGGHLARLAVHPAAQGRGIGKALVTDMIKRLIRIGVTTITVNTQSDNAASLALYLQIGFRETGVRYPVFVYDLVN